MPFGALKTVAGILLTALFVPLLFMGEEYGEDRPFLYFTDHSDPELASAIRQGRERELASFGWEGEPPDPLDAATFTASKIEWDKRGRGRGSHRAPGHRRLISLRREIACLACRDDGRVRVCASEADKLIAGVRSCPDGSAFWLANLGPEVRQVSVELPEGAWIKVLDAEDALWGGPGVTLPDRLCAAGRPDLSIGGYGFALFKADTQG